MRQGEFPLESVRISFRGFRILLSQSITQGGATADRAAEQASMSRSRLARRLKSHGTTISLEIDKAKLTFAEAELAANGASIEEIAAQLGHADPGNFARWFKRACGITLSAYRRQCMGQASAQGPAFGSSVASLGCVQVFGHPTVQNYERGEDVE